MALISAACCSPSAAGLPDITQVRAEGGGGGGVRGGEGRERRQVSRTTRVAAAIQEKFRAPTNTHTLACGQDTW